MTIQHAINQLTNDPVLSELFAEWAFGDKYWQFEYITEFMDAWNDLHSQELLLTGDGYIPDDLKNMVELWKIKNNIS